MQTRHSAGGFRVTPSSCSVSEVLKTSQRTFLSETAGGIRTEQGRKNSGAPKVKRVISFTKEKCYYRVSDLSELITAQRQKKQVSFIKKDPCGILKNWVLVQQISCKATFWLKVIPQTLSTLYSHNHRVLITADQIILGKPHNLHPRRNGPHI